MNRYEIRCTEEQTRKALELGAPIINYPIQMSPYGVPKYERQLPSGKWIAYIVPTAEQMLGWLEDQGFIFSVFKYGAMVEYDSKGLIGIYEMPRKEAIHAAIDAALEYLENIKQ